MTITPHYDRCAYCRRRFRQRMGPGRKKDYCDTRCRRLAQRQRDGQSVQLPAAAASPWGRDVAEDLQSLVAELVEAEQRRQPLPVLLTLATRLGKELTYYTAAAVQDARSRGHGWEHIAAAAGVAVDTARLRWAEARIKRLLERRARERLASPPAPPGHTLPMPRSPK
ncbi:hypothetical protein [Streptomyces xantholiticus]|uniref:SpdA protein n=1 Tax=Streptomyces xantholiticus TaxID=68285 RepID=A0ABV1V5E3_9ACTN